MFSLIITIISIALVAALAIATLYYGGSAFSQGSAKAVADTVIAQSQQITGANTLYANDNGGNLTASVSTLVSGNYLAAQPAIPAAAAASGTYYTLGAVGGDNNGVQLTMNGSGSSSVCLAIAKSAGTVAATATSDARTAVSTTAQYDCAGAAATNQFAFKG